MENASKALIIAGAILLSILLISLGIMVYNNAKGTVNNANLDSETVQAFNTKFTQYGGKQRGTALNALIDTAIASNAKSGHTVKIFIAANTSTNTNAYGNDANTGGDVNTAPRFENSETKNVTFGYDTDGYVNIIRIK